MNPYEQLTAPLLHVKKQFRQNCLFMFDGALFLASPELIAQVRVCLAYCPTDNLIVLDVSSQPYSIQCSQLRTFLTQAEDTLRDATEKFNSDRDEAYSQFQKLLEVPDLDDEKTE